MLYIYWFSTAFLWLSTILTNSQTVQPNYEQLMTAELAFAQLALERGIRTAFVENLDEQFAVFHNFPRLHINPGRPDLTLSYFYNASAPMHILFVVRQIRVYLSDGPLNNRGASDVRSCCVLPGICFAKTSGGRSVRQGFCLNCSKNYVNA